MCATARPLTFLEMITSGPFQVVAWIEKLDVTFMRATSGATKAAKKQASVLH